MNDRLTQLAALSLVAFIVTSIVLRLVLPFGDEPDYTIKAFKIVEGVDFSFISVIADVFRVELDFVSYCAISARPFGLSAQIDPSTCFEPFYIQLIRLISVLITILPFVYIIVKPNLLRKIYSDEFSHRKAVFRVKCVLASLPFPGMVYFLGLLSVEHLTLVIGLLGFIFFDRLRIFIPLMALSSFFDFGNTIVALFFFLNLFFFGRIDVNLRSRLLFIGYAVGAAALFLVSGVSILKLSVFQIGAVANKSSAIYDALEYGSQSELKAKYNIMLRPIITLSSLVLITPAYIKAPAAFMGMIIWFVKWTLISGQGRDRVEIKHSYVYFGAALFSIFLLTITLPTYAYGKYYAICIPALLGIFVAKQGAQKVILYSVGLTFLTFVNLLYFWT